MGGKKLYFFCVILLSLCNSVKERMQRMGHINYHPVRPCQLHDGAIQCLWRWKVKASVSEEERNAS